VLAQQAGVLQRDLWRLRSELRARNVAPTDANRK
jgi:hypothetical protein